MKRQQNSRKSIVARFFFIKMTRTNQTNVKKVKAIATIRTVVVWKKQPQSAAAANKQQKRARYL